MQEVPCCRHRTVLSASREGKDSGFERSHVRQHQVDLADVRSSQHYHATAYLSVTFHGSKLFRMRCPKSYARIS